MDSDHQHDQQLNVIAELFVPVCIRNLEAKCTCIYILKMYFESHNTCLEYCVEIIEWDKDELKIIKIHFDLRILQKKG